MTILTRNHQRPMPVFKTIATVSLAAMLSAGLLPAAGLTINSPADGSSTSPGTTLPVTVAASGSFTEVVVVGEGPIGFSKVISTAPYQFNLTIPAKLPPGLYSVTAIGATSGGSVYSTPITLSVERTDAPVELHVTPDTLTLPVGDKVALRVIGTYADGTKLDITRSVSSSFSSNSGGVASVDSQGNVMAVGPGTARITVNNSLNIPVTVPTSLTIAPTFPVVYGKQSADFSAFRPGMAPISVNWTISPPQIGSINPAGVYTAPKDITTPQLVTIIATLKSDATKSVSTGVVLFPPVSVSVSPSGPVPLTAGQTMRFAQSVNNSLDSGVDWSISPKNSGTIDSTGLYTAPATIKNQTTVTVTATSITDQSKTGTATITLQP
jgi:hypothetical protein